MNWPAILGLLMGVAMGLQGARMVSQSAAFIGEGRLDARDPRTVKIFGKAFVLMGAAIVILSILSFQGA